MSPTPLAAHMAATHGDLDLVGDFPVLSRKIDGRPIVYLDSAATSLKPLPVIDAVASYYREFTANIHRGKHRLSEEASDRYEEARYQAAAYCRCSGNEVVFTRNTTDALNLVAQGLSLDKSDLIVCSLDSHHSQLLPWREAGQVRLVRTETDGGINLEHFHELLALKPKVVALTHCSNVTGRYLPIETMVTAAKASGAIVVLDAAQSMPHRRLDLRKLPVDFVAFSGHKMLGPSGVGVLIGRGDMLGRLRPVNYGGGSVDWVSVESSTLRKLPHRLEAGTPSIEGVIGLGAAFEYLEEIGDDTLRAHDQALSAEMLRQVAARPWLHVLGPVKCERAALVSVAVDGLEDLGDVVRALSDSYGVMVRSGHLCAQPYVDAFTPGEVMRLSGYIYNTVNDVRHAFHALDHILTAMGYR
jgi:cysteine desulfurase / selenocysteine lyase